MFLANVFLFICETFLHENNFNFYSYKFSYKFAFIQIFLQFFWFSRTKQERKSVFGRWWTKNVSAFCLWWVALYFKGIPNSVDFYLYMLLLVYNFMIEIGETKLYDNFPSNHLLINE